MVILTHSVCSLNPSTPEYSRCFSKRDKYIETLRISLNEITHVELKSFFYDKIPISNIDRINETFQFLEEFSESEVELFFHDGIQFSKTFLLIGPIFFLPDITTCWLIRSPVHVGYVFREKKKRESFHIRD